MEADSPDKKTEAKYMSTVSSSLSSGLQALSNADLLPSNLTTQQLQNASPAELTQNAIANAELTTISSLFGNSTSTSDSVSLSSNLDAVLFGDTSSTSSATSNPLLQALDSATTTSANCATSAATSPASSDTNPGSLFSYMG